MTEVSTSSQKVAALRRYLEAEGDAPQQAENKKSNIENQCFYRILFLPTFIVIDYSSIFLHFGQHLFLINQYQIWSLACNAG